MRVLRYQGTVAEFRRALLKHRMATEATSRGALLCDDRERRRFQRYLRRAEMASLRWQILTAGQRGRDGGGVA